MRFILSKRKARNDSATLTSHYSKVGKGHEMLSTDGHSAPYLAIVGEGKDFPPADLINGTRWWWGGDLRVRKFTPREAFRLMGVREKDIDTLQASGVSNTSLYMQAGNSIVVDCLAHILDSLFYGN